VNIVTPITILGGAFCKDVFNSFVGSFDLTVALRMIGGSSDMMDVISVGEDIQEFVDEFGALVSGENLGDTVSADYIFIEK
jgi:hypothetical protein